MNKAQAERLTQLARAARGQSTKRSLAEILASEKAAARAFIPQAKVSAPLDAAQPGEPGE